jgi:hypothetical protein
MVHEQLHIVFSLFLLHVLFPNAEHVHSAAFVVWARESVLVVTVALTIVETHQATLFENMVRSNNLNQLGM